MEKTKKTKIVQIRFVNILWTALIIALFAPFILSLLFGHQNREISLSQFIHDLRDDKVETIRVAGDKLNVSYREDNNPLAVKIVRKEDGQTLFDVLSLAQIDPAQSDITIENMSFSAILLELVGTLLPLILIAVIFLFFFRQMKGGELLGIGKSKAKVFIKGKQDIKFADVGGMEEAKKELSEIVDFLKNPKKYQKLGARTPKGVLLVGPAGTGKTLLARAVAGEANVQFLSIAGSEFMEMLVGVGASRARDLFSTAKQLSPSIIFIDEIDVIGRIRGQGGGAGGAEEREQTLNQILVEMDGFTKNDNVIVMAATNRSEQLDPALIRPGRFDRRVQLSLPDLEEREFILQIHAKDKPVTADVHWKQIAKNTTGFSGADLENMLNEAAIATVQDNRTAISKEDLEEAAIKVKMGPSKKRLMDKTEREMTAYHEIGHAMVAHFSPHADKVSRISIISRGNALGYTLTPPEKDKWQTTKSELLDDMAVLLGGRVVEELVFQEQTAGASSDIERATRIARSMVEDLGMSKLGVMYYGPQYENNDYGRSWWEPRNISDQLQLKVDQEIQSIVKDAYTKAQKIITAHRSKLTLAANRLLEIETMNGDEFAALMGETKKNAV
ncbi:ATP-dependent zinc metalloprotease FtsH [Microgenomates group bacterium]|nr:ATP-dependent zinc metalloprotease FtsH [Microgenomates group bacterium]